METERAENPPPDNGGRFFFPAGAAKRLQGF
jgi:hypothetical protein